MGSCCYVCLMPAPGLVDLLDCFDGRALISLGFLLWVLLELLQEVGIRKRCYIKGFQLADAMQGT